MKSSELPGQQRRTPVAATSHAFDKEDGIADRLAGWIKEAMRLANEYLLTGKESHLVAFQTHMGGMLEHVYKHLRHKARSQGAVRN